MSKPPVNIQDGYLLQILKSGTPLTIELVNGRRIEGVLKRFDRFALILEQEGREKLVYKHAVATLEGQAAPA
jgi:host factor-I protein